MRAPHEWSTVGKLWASSEDDEGGGRARLRLPAPPRVAGGVCFILGEDPARNTNRAQGAACSQEPERSGEGTEFVSCLNISVRNGRISGRALSASATLAPSPLLPPPAFEPSSGVLLQSFAGSGRQIPTRGVTGGEFPTLAAVCTEALPKQPRPRVPLLLIYGSLEPAPS